MDRFNEFSDQQIWEALRLVGIASAIESLPLRLNSHVSDNGSNFSVGELCLFYPLCVLVSF